MNTRRNFMRMMALSAAGLYVPTTTFFLPPEGGWGTTVNELLIADYTPLLADILNSSPPLLYQFHKDFKVRGKVWTVSTRYKLEGILNG
jgi:hypothetical protein